MFKFTIDREVWARGSKETNILLNPQTGKMCCLGIYALACGLKSKDIENAGTPEEIPVDYRAIPKNYKFLIDKQRDSYYFSDSDIVGKFVEINDSNKYHGKRREDKIKKLFLKNNIEVDFIGKNR